MCLFRNRWVLLLCMAFASPFIAILFSQLLKHKIVLSYYDSPLRFILAIPILIALLIVRIKNLYFVFFSFPTTLILTISLLPLLPHTGWAIVDPDRFSSYFVDPLTFGRISLELALISILTPLLLLSSVARKNLIVFLIKIAALVIGLVLSIKSGSRTGWLALPFITMFLLFHFIRIQRIYSILVSIALVAALGLLFIYTDSPMQRRFNQAFHEITSYHWNAVNKDESASMRISFARIGFYLFELKPFEGWGDRDFKSHLNDMEINKFSTDFTRQYVLNAGFHNEFITNMVRSGIWGLISSILIFAIPFGFFWNQWICSRINIFALTGMSFVFFDIVSAFSTEVVNLKFTAAYYAYLIVLFVSQSLLFERDADSLIIK